MVLPPEFYFPFLNYKIWPGNCQGDADFTNALLTLKRLGRESEAPPAFRGNSFCHRLGALAWGGHCPPSPFLVAQEPPRGRCRRERLAGF